MGTTSSDGFELLLLGGRAGVGKTSVAAEVSLLLREAGVTHCHIEGDVLDAAYPKPQEDPDGSGPNATCAIWPGGTASSDIRGSSTSTP